MEYGTILSKAIPQAAETGPSSGVLFGGVSGGELESAKLAELANVLLEVLAEHLARRLDDTLHELSLRGDFELADLHRGGAAASRTLLLLTSGRLEHDASGRQRSQRQGRRLDAAGQLARLLAGGLQQALLLGGR